MAPESNLDHMKSQHNRGLKSVTAVMAVEQNFPNSPPLMSIGGNVGHCDKSEASFLPNSPFSRWLSAGEDKLPPEVERDNIEYKWRLTGMPEDRRIHLITQMRWRVGELGYCWYVLGVKDNGALDGLEEEDLEATLLILKELVHRAKLAIACTEMVRLEKLLKSTLQSPSPKSTLTFKSICQVRIEADPIEHLSTLNLEPTQQKEFKVAFLGDAGVGKSTLIGVLSDWGNLDDGRGRMRTRLLHHRHELLSGSTSSTSIQSIAYPLSSSGRPRSPLIFSNESRFSLEMRRELLHDAKIVHLVDTAGKLRFDHTVLSILTLTHKPDMVCLLLEAPKSIALHTAVSQQTLELIRLVRSLNIPLAFVISKIDQSSTEAIFALLEALTALLAPQIKLSLYSAAEETESDFKGKPDFGTFNDCNCPVLLCSAVSGDFLDQFNEFLFSRVGGKGFVENQPCTLEYIREVSSAALIIEQHAPGVRSAIPEENEEENSESVLPVVYGHVAFGCINVGDALHLGPHQTDSHSSSTVVRVASIQRLKFPVNTAQAGQYVTLALEGISLKTQKVHRGMAVIKKKSHQQPQEECLVASWNPAWSLEMKPIRRIIAAITRINDLFHHPYSHSHHGCNQRIKSALKSPHNLRSRPQPAAGTTTFSGILFIGGQKFPAILAVEPRSLRRQKHQSDIKGSDGVICLLSMKESRPATVFLQPAFGLIFVEECTGKRNRFVGSVIDYFA